LQILAYVSGVMDVESNVDHANFTMEDVESNIVRCPDQEAAQKMIDGAQQQQQQQQQQQHSSTAAASS
jgi:chorismate synthase